MEDEFDPMIHIVPDMNPADSDVTQVIAGVDFGANDPFVYLWIVEKDGRWIIADEYYSGGAQLEVHARNIRMSPWEARVEVRYGDYHGKQEIFDLVRYGINVIPAYKCKPTQRILEVTRLLNSIMKDKRPQLLV